MMYGYYGDHMDGAAWLGMALSFVLFWGLLALLALVLVRSLRGGHSGHAGHAEHGRPTPGELLAQRFARGEIDEAEYAARLRALHEQGY